MFKSVLFLMMPNWKQPMFLSIETWINKMWYGHIKDNDTVIKLRDPWG